MQRIIGKVLRKRLDEDRAIALLGPRQTGKSFILDHFQSEEKVSINLDDPLLREEVAADPINYLRKRYEKDKFLFIDEAAKVPAVFDAIKILIDEKGSNPSRICIANSGNYLLMKRIKESLAGRVSLLQIYPFSWREFCTQKKPAGLLQILLDGQVGKTADQPESFTEVDRLRNERLLWGGYPVPALAPSTEIKIRWISDYFKTYIFPILIEQFNIRALESFEKFTRLLFLQSSSTLNYNRLAQETGISQPTAVTYVHLLKAMMLIVTLETYVKNPRKRITKQPKIHVVDPLLLHLSFGTGFNLQTANERGQIGAIYESFIAFEIIKTLENEGMPYQVYTWRTADKAEVDIIIEAAGKTLPIEIKFSKNLSGRDISGLKAFLEDNPYCSNGYVIYPGKEIVQLGSQVTAIPDWLLLGAV